MVDGRLCLFKVVKSSYWDPDVGFEVRCLWFSPLCPVYVFFFLFWEMMHNLMIGAAFQTPGMLTLFLFITFCVGFLRNWRKDTK